MNADVLSLLTSLTLTEAQAETLNDNNGEDLEVPDLPYIELDDLIAAGVGKGKAKRLLRTTWPKDETAETASVDAVPQLVAGAPQNITVQIDNSDPLTLETMSLGQALDFLSGESEIPTDAEFDLSQVAEKVDGLAYYPFVVLTSEGKVDKADTRACFKETKKHGRQRKWEGKNISKAATLVEGGVRYLDPLFGDLLTPTLYNNQRNFSWAPAAMIDGNVDVVVLGMVAYARSNGDVAPGSTRHAKAMVGELAEPMDDFWKGLKGDYAALDSDTRHAIERGLTFKPSDTTDTTDPNKAPPPAPVSSSLSFSNNPNSALRELLISMFSTHELARFLDDNYPRLTHNLPSRNSPVSHYAYEAVEQMRQRGLIDEVLFTNFKRARPFCLGNISAVQARFGF